MPVALIHNPSGAPATLVFGELMVIGLADSVSLACEDANMDSLDEFAKLVRRGKTEVAICIGTDGHLRCPARRTNPTL